MRVNTFFLGATNCIGSPFLVVSEMVEKVDATFFSDVVETSN